MLNVHCFFSEEGRGEGMVAYMESIFMYLFNTASYARPYDFIVLADAWTEK
jgi:hypothetical protein